MTSITPEQVVTLRDLVKALKKEPELLHDVTLAFFREYLVSLGANIPHKIVEEPDDEDDMPDLEPPEPVPESEPEPEPEEQEEPEPVDPDVIPAESDPPQPTGDLNAEVSEENRDKAQELRGEASELQGQGDFEGAIRVLTEAITKYNGNGAPLYASRGLCYLKLKKPASAIRDAEVAIKINPDSAAPFRVRGRARALLGDWVGAAADLKAANQRDYDPDVNDLLKVVSKKADEFLARQKKREEIKRKKEAKNKPTGGSGGPKTPFGGMPFGGMPGGGGMPKVPPEILNHILSDPEVLAAMQDPTVMPILTELMKDPSAALKYKDHPKIGKLLAKFANFVPK